VRQAQPDPVEEFIENPPVAPVRAAVPVPEPVAQPEPVAAVPVVERQPAVEPEPQRKRVETKKFVGEIFKDGKDWVAELNYKNGAGTERFTAGSKDDLMMKILEGKGHGTVKVRETVQRYKLGDVYDDWSIFYNEVKESHGLSIEEYNALPDQSRKFVQDTVQAAYLMEFIATYPEYYAVTPNRDRIYQYLNSRKIPLTLHNLELAYRDLNEDDLLETRPVQKEVLPTTAAQVPATSAQVTVPQTEDSVVEVPAAPAVAATPAPVRKRGTTGLIPGQSSAVPATESAPLTEDGKKSQEPSEQELREARDAATRGDFSALKRIATQGRKYGARY
jgi:hypothetical protein